MCIIKYYLYKCYANVGIELALSITPTLHTFYLSHQSFPLLAESTNIR